MWSGWEVRAEGEEEVGASWEDPEERITRKMHLHCLHCTASVNNNNQLLCIVRCCDICCWLIMRFLPSVSVLREYNCQDIPRCKINIVLIIIFMWETHHFSLFPDYFLGRLIDPVASSLVTLSHCSFWDVRKYICVKLFSLKWKMEMKHLIKGKKWQEQLGKMIKWSSGYNFLLLYFLRLSDKKYQRCQIVIGISEVSEKC